MNMYRKFYLLTVIVSLLVAACTPQATGMPNATSVPSATAAPDKSITLRLAVADERGYPSEPYVLEFVDQVKNLSNGSIIVDLAWNAGNQTEAGFESGVIQLVKSGTFDLGLAASRAFMGEGINAFRALQAPFLIDNNALAEAVATSDNATKMLGQLASTGLTGLTLWPEDLRHPFSTLPDKPILSPADFSGRNIRVTDQGMSKQLIEALGGIPMTGESGYEGAESGLRQGRSLSGVPTATGNVTFFPKYQVLFANDAAFKNLNDTQRSILKEAALATQKKAISEHPSEKEAGQAWCADGGTIVLASEAQVVSFVNASQPIFDSIKQDSFNAEMITSISQLKSKTPPSVGAAACAPVAAHTSPEPTKGPELWSTGLLPNGVWQAKLTPDDLMGVGGILQSAANQQAGTQTFTFHDGKFTWSLEGDNTGYCEGTYALVGELNRLTLTGDCSPEIDDVRWRLDDQGLYFQLVDIKNAPFAEIKANLEAKPYQKIADQ